MGIAIAISIRLGEGGGKGPQQTATKNGQVEWEVEWEHTSQVEWFGKVLARPPLVSQSHTIPLPRLMNVTSKFVRIFFSFGASGADHTL